jgi:hypothetical protein
MPTFAIGAAILDIEQREARPWPTMLQSIARVCRSFPIKSF